MFHGLYLPVISLIMGAILSCPLGAHSLALRRHREKSKFLGKERLPLEDLILRIENAEAQNDSKTALKLYEKICKDYKTSDVVPWAYYFRGLTYENNHQFTAAIKMFTKIVKCYPESVWFPDAIEHYFWIAKKLQGGVRPRYFGTIPGLRDYDSAVKDYELVVKYAPYSYYAPQALIEIANLHLRAKYYHLAIGALAQLIDVYPDSVEVPSVYLKIAEIYSSLVKGDQYNQGGAVTALRYYNEFCSLFPGHVEINFVNQKIRELEESVVRSEIALGDFYFNTRYNGKAAKMLYRSAIDFAPHTSGAKVAEEKIQGILNGIRPKSTPVDFLFASYKPKEDEPEGVTGGDDFNNFVDKIDLAEGESILG
ncbi:MAG: outer membrane protein assembly factor BamD [Puniceicoccales bacterium]|nr:outer membrane protein assembly factor BamD [Puniceicoccales bacterium]